MSDENLEVVRRTMDAYNTRDLPAYLDTLSESVRFQSRFSAMDRVYCGHEDLRRYFAELDEVWSRYEMQVQRLVPAGRQVAALCHLYAIGRGSDLQVEEDSAVVFTVEAGKIVRIDAYPTHAEALAAVGLSESAMSQQNVDLARRNFELASQGTDDEIARRLAPDVEWHHNIGLGTPMEGIYHGREEVLELFRTLRESFGMLEFELEQVRALSSSEVLSLGYLHVEGRGSGAAATTPFGALTEIRDGLTVRHRFWMDRDAALEAAGLSE